MAQSRYYSANAQPTVLTANITPTSTIIQVAQTVGFPATTPFILALDYGNASEEVVLCTSVAGLSLTVTRGYDGTSATSHNAGAAVRHTWTAMDGNDSRAHEGSTSGVHGVVGNVVGTTDTQTLTNKTLNSPTINSPTFGGTVSLNNPTITGTVAGGASYTGITATNPTVTGTVAGGASYTSPTITTPTITSPSITGTVSGGATYSAHQDNDLTVRNSATGVVPLTVNAIAGTSVNLTEIALNGTNRLTLSTNGQLFVNSASAATNPLRVNIPSAPTADVAQFQINGVNQVRVNTTGTLVAVNGFNAGAAAFNVDATGNLTAATNMTMGAWNTYSPTWTTTGTAPVLGNGTLNGRYCKNGRDVTLLITFLAGTTTTFGTGEFRFSLPVTQSSAVGASNFYVGSAFGLDAGTAFYSGTSIIDNTSNFVRVAKGDGTLNFWSATQPFTWGNTDSISIEIKYESAT